MKTQLTIFGEMLWDMLPTGKQPGGAPMNVAIHLNNFGLEPAFISRVGDDDLGSELMEYLGKQGLNIDMKPKKIVVEVVKKFLKEKQREWIVFSG